MIKNLSTTIVAAIPLTAISDMSRYFIQDWEFVKWILVLVSVDTVLGIWKHLIHKDASSREFWSHFAVKMGVYLVLLILSNVLASFTVEGSPVGVVHWMSEYLCVFMVIRESVSIVENIQAIYPILPTWFVKRLKDFNENGEYVKK